MQDYIEKGYAEKVRADGKRNACTWFLPHHPVMNPKKPDKLTLLRSGFFLLSMSGGGGGGRFDPTLWKLITFEPLTIAIPFLLR